MRRLPHAGRDRAGPLVLYETSRNLEFQPHTLTVHIEDGANVGPGLTPAITFTVAVDGAPYDFRTNKLGALTFMMAGPTTDYAETFTVNCLTNNLANANGTAVDAAAGRFKATFPASAFGTGATGIPSDRTGSYVFTFEAYYFQQLPTDVTGVSVRKPFAANPEFVAKALTGSPTPRRVVVSKCDSCHVDLGFHSNRSRKGASYCATCHNPNLDNSGRMRFLETEAPYLVESVSMNVYIHRIHMGAELPTVVAGGKIRYGTNRTATDPTPGAEGYADLSKFESPSPMRNCATCHDGNSFALPELPGLLPNKRTTMTCADPAGGVDGSEWCNNRVKGAVVITPPLKAVCTSCHDALWTTTHADLNTLSPNSTGAVELCSGCHGLGKEWDSLVVHEPIP